MTYGWALLIVLVAIAVLAAYGVFGGGKRAFEACIFGTGFSCDSSAITSSAVIYLRVTNGMGRDITEFFVTLDPFEGKMCQGNTGSVASAKLSSLGYTLSNPLVPFTNRFNDGQTLMVKTPNLPPPSFPLPTNEGIGCGQFSFMCCFDYNARLSNPVPPTFSLPCLAPPCHPSGVYPLPAGARFKENLYVTYKFSDSTLIHSRQGLLAGLIEAS